MEHTVEAVMTSEVVTAQPSTPFQELVRLLEQCHISALPVVDDSGRLVGIVSGANMLIKEGYPHGATDASPVDAARYRKRLDKAAGTRAAELMAAPVSTVPLGTLIADACRWWTPVAGWLGSWPAAICSRCSCGPTPRCAGRSTTTSSAGSSASPTVPSRSRSAARLRRWSGAPKPWMAWRRSTPGSPGASTTRCPSPPGQSPDRQRQRVVEWRGGARFSRRLGLAVNSDLQRRITLIRETQWRTLGIALTHKHLGDLLVAVLPARTAPPQPSGPPWSPASG